MKNKSKKQNQIIIKVNPKVYPLEAVYGASYVFLDRAYIFLEGDPKKEIRVRLKAKEETGKGRLKDLIGEFQNELLNYALRNEISKRNAKIREYIVAQALFASNPEEFKEPEAEYKKDAFNIAVPWGEKYGKKSKKIRKKSKNKIKKK